MRGRSTGCEEGVGADGTERYRGVRGPAGPAPPRPPLGAGPRWQRQRLVSSPGNKVSCNSDRESAFPLSIIHSEKCDSTGLGGNGRREGIFHDTLGSALLSPPQAPPISSQVPLGFHAAPQAVT